MYWLKGQSDHKKIVAASLEKIGFDLQLQSPEEPFFGALFLYFGTEGASRNIIEDTKFVLIGD